MNLGELFFSLGFKTSGLNEAKQFESFISGANVIAENLSSTLNQMVTILSKVALSMKAITKDEFDKIGRDVDARKNIIDETKNNKKLNEVKKESIRLVDTHRMRFSKWSDSLKSGKTIILSFTTALGYMMKKALDTQLNLGKSSAITGYSQETIEKLRNVAATTNTEVNSIMGTISALQEQAVNIAAGEGGNIGAFMRLGLSPNEDPIIFLGKLGKRLKELPTDIGTKLARDIGISDDMIYTVKAYGDELEKIGASATKTDKIAKLNNFSAALNRLFNQAQRILVKFAVALSPVLTPFMNTVEKFAGEVLPYLINRFGDFVKELSKYAPNIKKIAFIIATALFPLTAKITAIVLALDDLRAFFKGEDSLFGSFLKYLTNINGAAKDLIHFLVSIARLFGLSAENAVKLENSMLGGWKNFVGSSKVGETKSDLQEGWDNIKFSLGRGMQKVRSVWGEQRLTPEMKKSLNENNKPTTNNNNVNINVNGAKDPKQTAQEINKILGKSYWQTQRGER